ncbi:phosphatidylinositol-specific phospholipase C [Kitasatospora sp. NPDC056446]|uniref:phosphatidylinositol-specific phospholipase C n=1 Tax=Kitasatospora sp. NPDC056446 TaxID=3345819 RepID=UPI00368D0270
MPETPLAPARGAGGVARTVARLLVALALLLPGPLVAAQSAAAVGSTVADAFNNLGPTPLTDWMSAVPGSTSLARMSVPGTHETNAIHGGDYVQTQQDFGDSGRTLAAQLNAGIRAVDVRVRIVESNKFAIHHGAYYQQANFDDVLQRSQDFLRQHPGETILMRLKAECVGGLGGCKDDAPSAPSNSCTGNVPWTFPGDLSVTQQSNMVIFCDYLKRYPGLFYAPSVQLNVTTPDPAQNRTGGFTVQKSAVPMLMETRGHIVLTNYDGPAGGDYGLGIDNYAGHIEDHYQSPTTVSKLALVKTNLEAAANATAPEDAKAVYVTYTSASTVPGNRPIQYAGGYSDDFGNVTDGVNIGLLGYLNDPASPIGNTANRLGVVMMDFPGWALIQNVIAHNPVPRTPPTPPGPAPASVDGAYSFLTQAMDKYGTGDEKLRIPRSYQGGYFDSSAFPAGGFQASFTYDNALVITALLQRPTGSNLSHAVALGNSLLYAQAHDPQLVDGRLRASYEPDPFVTPAGTPYVGGYSVYTGNMAWAGMALTRLYKATGQQSFLYGALDIAGWIQNNAHDSRGVGGYTGGQVQSETPGSVPTKITWKATEHNIDTGAFFAMLNNVTGVQVWKDRSDEAFAFVRSMRTANGHLWTGTGLDGVTVNEDYEPEDVQTWSFLATLDPAYGTAVDWAAGRLAVTDGPFKGVSFSGKDTSKVWFEGTAHLLAAYNARGAAGDGAKAGVLLATLQKAQTSAPNADGKGIVAASRDGLDTGQGDLYYSSLHTGTTAWYLIAAQGGNPFRL